MKKKINDDEAAWLFLCEQNDFLEAKKQVEERLISKHLIQLNKLKEELSKKEALAEVCEKEK